MVLCFEQVATNYVLDIFHSIVNIQVYLYFGHTEQNIIINVKLCKVQPHSTMFIYILSYRVFCILMPIWTLQILQGLFNKGWSGVYKLKFTWEVIYGISESVCVRLIHVQIMDTFEMLLKLLS